MYQLMINRKNSKKGFTLVEVIVVLVILAILAAIMVPAMTGWIEKARDKAIIVEARNCYLAAQAVASELYAPEGKVPAPTDITKDMILDIAIEAKGVPAVTEIDGTTAQITGFTYSENGKTATLADGAWTVGDAIKP